MTEDTERAARIKQDFIEARGYWSYDWDPLLDMAPDYFAAYANLSPVPWKSGTLSPKVKELLYIAVDSSTTHMSEPGLRIHIRNALRYGATRDVIMEVFQFTSVLGVHTVTMGVPAPLEAVQAPGRGWEIQSGALTPRQEALKATFIANRGY